MPKKDSEFSLQNQMQNYLNTTNIKVEKEFELKVDKSTFQSESELTFVGEVRTF